MIILQKPSIDHTPVAGREFITVKTSSHNWVTQIFSLFVSWSHGKTVETWTANFAEFMKDRVDIESLRKYVHMR